MEIRTLLKANIKSKKGTFISTFILTLLIVSIASAILSVRANMYNALDKAYSELDSGNVNVIIANRFYNDEMRQSLADLDEISRVREAQSVVSDKHFFPRGNTDSNSYFNFTLNDARIKLYNSTLDGFEETVPPLLAGEIYLPLGLHSSMGCNVGETMAQEFADGKHYFKIKGFVEEPLLGAEFIGWKQVYISDEDYSALFEALAPYETDKNTSFLKIVSLYKADKSMTDLELKREINKKTGIITKSVGSDTITESRNYTTLFTNICTGAMLGFVLILFVIVLVMIAHGIKTEIEIDFENLGILKAQGFSDKTLNTVIALRYLSAQLLGAVLGVIISLPLERFLSMSFMSNSAILPERSFAFGRVGLLILAMLMLSLLTVFIMTRKLSRISPIRAISGGKGEVYFSGLLTVPVTKRALMPTIAIRSITSDIKKYIGLIFITALLAFFAVTVNIMAGAISSRSALISMGGYIDVGANAKESISDEKLIEIEKEIEKITPIEMRDYEAHTYLSLDGLQIMGIIAKHPEDTEPLKGRMPKYDNEIAVTEIVAEQYGYKIGDKVKVSGKKKEEQYLITGFYQSASDAGLSFMISLDGVRRLGDFDIFFYGFVLGDPEKSEAVAKMINQKYSDVLSAEHYELDKEISNNTIIVAGRAMQVMVYIFAVIFTLVSIIMVCSKAFAQERTDIGVYKAIGFTSLRLRRQFSVRYFLVALVGCAVGAALGGLFGVSLIEAVFKLFGISRLKTAATPLTYIGAGAFISASVALFSFMVSRRVKKIEVRELVTE